MSGGSEMRHGLRGPGMRAHILEPHPGDLCTDAFSRLRRSSHPLPNPSPAEAVEGLNGAIQPKKAPLPGKGEGLGRGVTLGTSIRAKVSRMRPPPPGRERAFLCGLAF